MKPARIRVRQDRYARQLVRSRRVPWQRVLGDITFTDKGDMTVPDDVFYVWRNGSYAEM